MTLETLYRITIYHLKNSWKQISYSKGKMIMQQKLILKDFDLKITKFHEKKKLLRKSFFNKVEQNTFWNHSVLTNCTYIYLSTSIFFIQLENNVIFKSLFFRNSNGSVRKKEIFSCLFLANSLLILQFF